jgi:predicted nucleic acid-binding protein
MKMVVLDASAIVSVLLDAAQYPALADHLNAEDTDILVPHLCDVEVTSALRRSVRLGLVGAEGAESALSVYLDLPLSRFPHTYLLRRAFSLRDNFTAYDATYVALAEAMGAALYTADHRLARAVCEHTSVDVVEV